MKEEGCGVCFEAQNWMRKAKAQAKKLFITSVYEPFPDPPDSAELGRATWTFLHTMAAFYPEQADPEMQKNMSKFIETFSEIYPCQVCAAELRIELETNKPKVNSRTDFSQWLCNLHNSVNARLGKPEFDCSKVFQRWRRSSP